MGVVKLDWRNVDVRRLRTGAVDRTEWESVVRGDMPILKGRSAKEEGKELLPMILLVILPSSFHEIQRFDFLEIVCVPLLILMSSFLTRCHFDVRLFWQISYLVQYVTRKQLICFSKAKISALFQVFTTNIGYTCTLTSKLNISP
jgi:hypothetical protein